MTAQQIGRRQFSATALGFAAWGALPGGMSAWAQASDTIVLGQSAALTGPLAWYGAQYQAGARVALDKVNAQGGIARNKIELRTLDDGSEPHRCVANTHKFISDGAFALFGYIGAATSEAALPLIGSAKIPFIAPFTGATGVRQPFNRWVFHVRASYEEEAERIARHLTNLKLQRIAVFLEQGSKGQAGLAGVTQALAARQLKPTATAMVERPAEQMAAAVQKLVASHPEAIVLIGTWQVSAGFVRAVRAAGYGGMLYSVSSVGTKMLAEALGKDGAGVIVSQVIPSPWHSGRRITREFLQDIQTQGAKVEVNYCSFEGYLAARVLLEGLRAAIHQSNGKLTREALVVALETMNGEIGGFRMAFSWANHQGSHFVDMSMLTGDGQVRT